MKISLNWLKEYIQIDLSTEALKDLLTDIGLEVEAVEHYESVKGGLRGIKVAEVVDCYPHPDADKLKVTQINDGSGELLQVVCGAPNVAKGQKVVFSPIGTTLYPAEGEPFQIKKAKIRGVESNGMLCAEDEIGLGSSHAGIIVLQEDLPVGKPVSEIYDVVEDTVFEIGLTPNRIDAFSHYGVARDLAAALNFRNKTSFELKKPAKSVLNSEGNKSIKVEVQNTEACPRYAGVVVEGLKIAPSPFWLQERLKAIDLKPINNVVDITNYVLHEYGQPLHAFDLSAIQGHKIVVGNLPEGSIFKTLDGEDRKLSAEDLMINHASDGMCIAGVYGGLHSGVKESTSAIFLESAYFNPVHIRRTSMRLGLRTDAAQHFEKGVDPNITVEALKRAVYLLETVAGGKVTSGLTDIQNQVFNHFEIQLNIDTLRKVCGVNMTEEEILRILDMLEIKVVDHNGNNLSLEVPPYRADVTREIDVIEDVLRIYGYNNIVLPKRITAALNIEKGIDADKLYQTAANFLVSQGFYEMLNNSITRSKQLEGLFAEETQVRLLSSINAELDVLRPCMQVSALEVLQYNINRSQRNLKLFEYGKTYVKEGDKNIESRHLFITATGDKQVVNWNTASKKTDIYFLKSIVMNLLTRLGVEGITMEESTDALYQEALTLVAGGKPLAIIGSVSKILLKRWDIKQDIFVADILWEQVIKVVEGFSLRSAVVPKFPSVRRDLALLLDKNVTFTQIRQIGEKFGKKNLRQIDLFDVYEGEKIGNDKKSYAVSFIFRDDEKTLQDNEVDAIMQKLIQQFGQQLNATIR
jgi:phenylalanyl-tRNA synthetase beta chain